ncbi:MAG: DUF2304 domain-containing protein [Clostridia bacterium]|nr:DUF2304 domain-containing protein [Clostridia bacterium]
MLPISLRIAIFIALVVYFCIFILLLKRKKLELKYTLLWLFSGVVMLILTVFPQLLGVVSSLLGIQVQSNALFTILFFCMLIILVSLTSINSKQNESIKRLVQQTAQLEQRIRALEGDGDGQTERRA